ncbi:MAG: electron transport complex subunit RsxE [Oscillospiraceae bacterium]|jgi:electron transport complex protein RnfE
MKEKLKIIKNGMFDENPVTVLVLGTCSALAISVTVLGALGMGAALTFVLICSNIVISALRKMIPDKVRIPCYITVIAAFVTLVEMVMEAYFKNLYDTLGIFLSLIVVNCIVLGRAEMYASKHGVLDSACDGLGMGLGYTMVLVSFSIVRELIGSGTLLGYRIIPEGYQIGIVSKAPGGFFVYGCAVAVFAAVANAKKKKAALKKASEASGGQAAADGEADRT